MEGKRIFKVKGNFFLGRALCSAEHVIAFAAVNTGTSSVNTQK